MFCRDWGVMSLCPEWSFSLLQLSILVRPIRYWFYNSSPSFHSAFCFPSGRYVLVSKYALQYACCSLCSKMSLPSLYMLRNKLIDALFDCLYKFFASFSSISFLSTGYATCSVIPYRLRIAKLRHIARYHHQVWKNFAYPLNSMYPHCRSAAFSWQISASTTVSACTHLPLFSHHCICLKDASFILLVKFLIELISLKPFAKSLCLLASKNIDLKALPHCLLKTGSPGLIFLYSSKDRTPDNSLWRILYQNMP